MANREMPGRNTLPGNSYSARDNIDISADKKPDGNTKEVKAVVKPKQVAQGKVRKQSALRKLGKYIIEDTVEEAREHTVKEILIPGIRNLIFDTFNEMVARLLYGDDNPRPASNRGGNHKGGRTSYDKYYDDKRRGSGRTGSYRDEPYDPDDIILPSRAAANDALDELDFIINKYGQASIATFYDIVGVSGVWTDNKYGWTSIRGAQIKPVRDGYMILLPPTKFLED